MQRPLICLLIQKDRGHAAFALSLNHFICCEVQFSDQSRATRFFVNSNEPDESSAVCLAIAPRGAALSKEHGRIKKSAYAS
jgi:hypothetical protein